MLSKTLLRYLEQFDSKNLEEIVENLELIKLSLEDTLSKIIENINQDPSLIENYTKPIKEIARVKDDIENTVKIAKSLPDDSYGEIDQIEKAVGREIPVNVFCEGKNSYARGILYGKKLTV